MSVSLATRALALVIALASHTPNGRFSSLEDTSVRYTPNAAGLLPSIPPLLAPLFGRREQPKPPPNNREYAGALSFFSFRAKQQRGASSVRPRWYAATPSTLPGRAPRPLCAACPPPRPRSSSLVVCGPARLRSPNILPDTPPARCCEMRVSVGLWPPPLSSVCLPTGLLPNHE